MSTENLQDIPEVPRQIIDAASKGKLVVFVGAGVSRLVGCPSWDKLARGILEEIFAQKWITYHEKSNLEKFEAKKLISICWNIIIKKNDGSIELKTLLSENLAYDENLEVFENLYKFKAVYVTTNLDKCLDTTADKLYSNLFIRETRLLDVISTSEEANTIQEKLKPEPIIYRPSNVLISDLEPGKIIHLHGGVGDPNFHPDELILTTRQYLTHYQDNGYLREFIKELFSRYTVLFVGYGLEEYELLEYLIKSGKIGSSQGEIKHFMLYPVFKTEENLLKIQEEYYLKDFGIKPIPYFIDNNGYAKLADVIEKWAEQIGPCSKPQSFIEQTRLIDEVL